MEFQITLCLRGALLGLVECDDTVSSVTSSGVKHSHEGRMVTENPLVQCSTFSFRFAVSLYLSHPENGSLQFSIEGERGVPLLQRQLGMWLGDLDVVCHLARKH